MQTFLPYPDFVRSAQTLDRQRLGKQRVEALQLLNALNGKSRGWANHPAAVMWRGYECTLALYGFECCMEWIRRGYNDTCAPKICAYGAGLSFANLRPPWFGDAAFHASHRSNLLRKDPVHYGRFGWVESDDLPYVWPTNSQETT